MARLHERTAFFGTSLVAVFFACGVQAAADEAPPARPSIALAATTAWQPPGGEFHFFITSPADDPGLPSACLSWSSDPSPDCKMLVVHRVGTSTTTPQVAEFAAALPYDLEPRNAEPYFLRRSPDALKFVWRAIGPYSAYISINAKSANPYEKEVGITSRLLAGLIAVFAVLLCGYVLLRFADRLDVPGPKETYRLSSIPLRLITGANGWASLSQMQIILWTFVVGAGGVYVMSLSGSMIPIGAGTLELLGIAGAASVLAEAKANQQSDPGASMTKPDPVTNLQIARGNEDTECVVTWIAPSGRTPIANYMVLYGVDIVPDTSIVWIEASRNLQDTRLRIVGLTPGTSYRVQVCATNPVDNGDWVQKTYATPAATLPAPAASIDNLRAALGETTEKSIPLECEAAGNALGIEVQFRAADSDDPWADAQLKTSKKSRVFNVPPGSNVTHFHEEATNFLSGTRYQFRARLKSGSWSEIVTASTLHVARWADIVTDTDRSNELDVTRVQMLIFTLISAFFVGLKIIDTDTIPDIPPEYVYLMGISNGVYITTKFVRR